MGRRIRAHDWARTIIGEPHTWSQALKTMVRLMLTSQHPMFIWWGDALVCFYNDAYSGLIGPDRHPTALGRPGREVWAEIWDIIGPQVAFVMSGQGATWQERQLIPITRGDRRVDVWWTYSYSPIDDEAAKNGIGGVLVICRDVTVDVLRERAQAAEAERLRLLFELAPGFMALLRGPEHVFELANAAYARLIGRDVLGRPVRDAVPEVEGQGFFELLDGVYASGEAFTARRAPLDLASPQGGTVDRRFVDFVYQPIRDASDGVTGIFVSGNDVTDAVAVEDALRALNETLESRVVERTAELQRTQDALRQSQKLEAMGQLTGGVAHDFNNLLTPIIGGLDLLQRRRIGNEREQRLINGALQSAERAKTLVQRLLAFARRQPLQAVPVDIAGLVEGMADLIASTSGPQIRMSVDIGPDLAPAMTDPNQTEMAILNLCVNARDAMPYGGRLMIAVSDETIAAGDRRDLAPGRYVRVSVADTGTGMDDATLARAIEPFFSTKGIGQGTGLGLSMVHGLVSQLGGGLRITSRPTLGTNVELWLPASADAVQTEDRAHDPSAVFGAVGTALLVDDEELARASTADMLAELGYHVLEAASAAEAIEVLSEHPRVTLLVTDHLMPGMTGAELARLVLQRRPATAVLIISGYAEAAGVAADLPRLTKPFRMGDLAVCLAALAR